MPCRWELAALVGGLVAAVTASHAVAQPASDRAPAAAAPAAPVAGGAAYADASPETSAASTPPGEVPVVYGALPGGRAVAMAITPPRGTITVTTIDGVGRVRGLLATDHRLVRAIGQLAISYAPTDRVAVALSLDGRYDKHYGVAPSGDDGYVGDPHLLVRLAQPVGGVRLGGQLGIWLPGKDAPSVAASAISVDARGLASIPLGNVWLTLGAGFRLDNSAKSVDAPDLLSLQDRVSLGVSDYHAVLGQAQLVIPAGNTWFGAEVAVDAFVGSPSAGSPTLDDGRVLVRLAATAGWRFTPTLSGLVFLGTARNPGISMAQLAAGEVPLVPYQPTIVGGIGLAARFGGVAATRPRHVETDCHTHTPPDCPVVITADISGTVVDEAGKPVVGARVALTLANAEVPSVVTDDHGAYVFKSVPLGSSVNGAPSIAEHDLAIAVTLDGKQPGSTTLAAVAQGVNTVAPIQLVAALPPGQLRGLVRRLPAGHPIAGATISVRPGGAHATTGADGTFSVDLPPGKYTITVFAKGMAQQELDVTIDPNGVAIKNIDLHR